MILTAFAGHDEVAAKDSTVGHGGKWCGKLPSD